MNGLGVHAQPHPQEINRAGSSKVRTEENGLRRVPHGSLYGAEYSKPSLRLNQCPVRSTTTHPDRSHVLIRYQVRCGRSALRRQGEVAARAGSAHLPSIPGVGSDCVRDLQKAHLESCVRQSRSLVLSSASRHDRLRKMPSRCSLCAPCARGDRATPSPPSGACGARAQVTAAGRNRPP
eukprot:549742-Prymnesium_polylepis.2